MSDRDPKVNCPTCNRPLDVVRICPCGRTFTINEGEQRFYHRNELSLPRYCAECRQARRQQKPTRA